MEYMIAWKMPDAETQVCCLQNDVTLFGHRSDTERQLQGCNKGILG